jgi:hypothetical protein
VKCKHEADTGGRLKQNGTAHSCTGDAFSKGGSFLSEGQTSAQLLQLLFMSHVRAAALDD